MNRLYIGFDGDSIGQKIGQAILKDNAQELHDYSKKIEAGNTMFKNWALSKGATVLSCDGDQGLFMLDMSNLNEDELMRELEEVRHKYRDIVGASATVGVGLSLSQSGKSLMAGKLLGKDILVVYDDHVEQVLEHAHQDVAEGHGDEESNKIDEQYLSPTMEDGEMSEDIDEDDSDWNHESTEISEDMDEDDAHHYDEEMGEHPEDENFEPGMESNQYHDLEEDRPIEIEDASKDTEEKIAAASKDENESPNMDEQNPEFKAFQGMVQESSVEDSQGLKQQVAQVLEKFKSQKEQMKAMQQQSPELYEATLAMLHSMIEMSKMLFSADQDPQPESTEESVDNQEIENEQEIPK